MRESCADRGRGPRARGWHGSCPVSGRVTWMQLAEEYIRSQGGEPAFKGYGHDRRNLFPGTLCVSVDDEVVHGIPDGRVLQEGQVVSIDVGVKKNGFFGDGGADVCRGYGFAGEATAPAVTETALEAGIAQARAGNRLHDVSHAVQDMSKRRGSLWCGISSDTASGRSLHEEPAVPNFGSAGTGLMLERRHDARHRTDGERGNAPGPGRR